MIWRDVTQAEAICQGDSAPTSERLRSTRCFWTRRSIFSSSVGTIVSLSSVMSFAHGEAGLVWRAVSERLKQNMITATATATRSRNRCLTSPGMYARFHDDVCLDDSCVSGSGRMEARMGDHPSG